MAFVVRLLMLALATCVCEAATNALPFSIAAGRKTYEEHLQRATDERLAMGQAAQADYLAGMAAAEADAQQRGDLDVLLAIRAAAGKTGPDTATDVHPAVAALRQRRDQKTRAAELKLWQSVKHVTAQYLAFLEANMKRLTMDNRIGEAVALQEEAERVRALPLVREANTGLAAETVDAELRNVTEAGILAQRIEAMTVLRYSFDVKRLDRVEDEGGRAHSGRVAPGVTRKPIGRKGGCFEFDGRAGHIRVTAGPTLNTTNGLTVAVWVRWNGASSRQTILSRGVAGTTVPGWLLFLRHGSVFTAFNDSWGAFTISYTDVLVPKDTWTHVVLTAEPGNGTARLFVNGEIKQTQTVRGANTPGSLSDLLIGMSCLNRDFWEGCMDELLILGGALSEKEVAALYESYATRPGR